MISILCQKIEISDGSVGSSNWLQLCPSVIWCPMGAGALPIWRSAQGATLRFSSTCPPGKLHQNFTCPYSLFTCPSLEKVYNILNIMCLGQKMSLPTGQVADKVYLPRRIFTLPRATGQSFMSHPAAIVDIVSQHWLSMMIWCSRWSVFMRSCDYTHYLINQGCLILHSNRSRKTVTSFEDDSLLSFDGIPLK